MRIYQLPCLLLTIFGLFACEKERTPIETEMASEKAQQYLFLGHTYQKENRMDSRLEQINYSEYKGVWLGGDLCSETTRERATIDYLDAIFDLQSENTHWAVGNHDVRNGNLEWITEATGRDLFYVEQKDGITIAVLDTNMGHVAGRNATCTDRDKQATFIQNLVDTLQHTAHLVILTHWVIWGDTEPSIPCRELANNCLPTFQFICGEGSSRFPPFLYDKLVDLEQRDIDVIVVSGDGGIFTKGFHYQTQEGVDFLISGLYATLDRANPPTHVAVNLNPDSVLIFNHDVAAQTLDWEFVRLDDLVE